MNTPAARIAAVKSRLAAATPGPLQERQDHDYYQGGTYLGVGGGRYEGNEHSSGFDTFERDVCRVEYYGDKELLKHAHADTTFLLGELDKAQERERALAEKYEALSEWSLTARAKVIQLQRAIRSAMDNLGVPQPGYPAPVAEAYRILEHALASAEPAAPSAPPQGCPL